MLLKQVADSNKLKMNTEQPTILVVDDVVENIRLVANVLGRAGYRVAFATNGQQALENVREHRYDLILLDVMMPEMDGFAVCRQLKDSESPQQQIPVIFLTASGATDDILRGFAVGGSDYVTKPFNNAELLARVQTHLRLRSAQRYLEERYDLLQQEIHRRHHIESELRQTQRRLQNFLDTAEDLIFFRSLDGKASFFNRACSDCSGFSLEELNLNSALWHALFHPKDATEVDLFFTEHPNGCASAELEYRMRCHDHHWRWFHERLVGISKEDGSIQGYHCIARDITSQKMQLTQQLRHAEVLFEDSTEAIAIADESGRILNTNQSFRRLLGYSKTELVNQRLPDVFVSTDDDCWRMMCQAENWQGEVWYRRQNGELFPAHQKVTALGKEELDQQKKFLCVFHDLSEARKVQERLRQLIDTDPLTGLPNRLSLRRLVGESIAEAERHHRQVAILILDIDRFHQINDSLGPDLSDQVLKNAAEQLRRSLRTLDLVARIGGDEFGILIREMDDVAEAIGLAKRLQAGFQQPLLIRGQEIYLSFSIGISLYPRHGQVVDTLLNNAEAALYRAKSQGGSALELYTEDLNAYVFESLMLENLLHQALNKQQLQLYFQRQWSLANNKTLGSEVLLRWQHPELGMIPPDRFIPIAEQSNQIIEIGEWVLYHACEQWQRWCQAGKVSGLLSVNISVVQLQRGDLLETMRQVLKDTGIQPNQLVCELTESAVLDDLPRANVLLGALRQLGIQIALDDFGSGYASLGYLRQLPLDHLKIDKSLVRELPKNQKDIALIRTAVVLAKNLSLKLLAEGIENPQQQQFLLEEGCHAGQGYLRGRPVPAADFIAAEEHQTE